MYNALFVMLNLVNLGPLKYHVLEYLGVWIAEKLWLQSTKVKNHTPPPPKNKTKQNQSLTYCFCYKGS